MGLCAPARKLDVDNGENVSTSRSRKLAEPIDGRPLLQEQQWLTLIIDRLRDPEAAVEAADELVAFVGQQDEEGA